jgi:hypothetical protein
MKAFAIADISEVQEEDDCTEQLRRFCSQLQF